MSNVRYVGLDAHKDSIVMSVAKAENGSEVARYASG